MTVIRLILLVFTLYNYDLSAASDATVNEPKCSIYMAPSFTPGIGRGVFAGTSFQEGEVIDTSVTLAMNLNKMPDWQLNNYVWETYDDSTSMAEFGTGMLFNHRYYQRHKPDTDLNHYCAISAHGTMRHLLPRRFQFTFIQEPCNGQPHLAKTYKASHSAGTRAHNILDNC